tara:strand:- start:3025 stop:3651 length:627 start_codon:yes stop_codon:yes gene_type:complete
MLLNSNVKLLLVLLLAVVLIHMLNSKDEIPNEGEVEALTEDEIKNEEQPVDSEMPSPEEPIQVMDTPTNESNDESMIDSVLGTSVQPNDVQNVGSDVNESGTSVTARNMEKLIQENEMNKLKFNSSDLLPKEVNQDWFESDFSNAQVNVNDDNLVVTDRYILGVNTVGQSLKNPSYDIRANPPCPKFGVSPWLQSTIEPDFNIKPLME